MDEEHIPGDLIMVHGDLFREQKFHHTRVFCGQPVVCTTIVAGGETLFNPTLLVATSGTVSVGIDPSGVHYIARDGFPPTVFDLKQELVDYSRPRRES